MTHQFPVVFENGDWVVVDKPPHFLSVPSRMGKNDERPVVGLMLQEQLVCPIFPVHRLDFEVSGLLVFAKNPNSHRVGNRLFENHLIQKKYWAMTEGGTDFDPKNWKTPQEWKSKILKGKKRAYEGPAGKEAITLAEFKEKRTFNKNECLVWNLSPLTGRSHQLRFEMYKHKMPIVGDALYGSQISLKKEVGIALRAFELKIKDGVVTDGELKGLPKIMNVLPELQWV